MAMGKAHQAATTAVIPVAAAGAYALGLPPLLAAAGAVFALWCHPDRDLAPARIDGQLPLLLGMAGALVWAPYARAVPHRSWISHWPIVGTAGRLVYLLLLPLVAMPGAVVGVLSSPGGMAFVGALALADMVHWVMDW